MPLVSTSLVQVEEKEYRATFTPDEDGKKSVREREREREAKNIALKPNSHSCSESCRHTATGNQALLVLLQTVWRVAVQPLLIQ